MKTHSSNIISKNSNQYIIENFNLIELSCEIKNTQKIMDSLHSKKRELENKQDTKGFGFKIDERVKENLPTAQEEIEQFEKRVQKEVERRINEIEQKAYEDGFLKAKEAGYKTGTENVKIEVEPFVQEIKNHLQNFRKIREELLIKNERIIVDIIITCVEKIIMGSYKKNDDILKSMLRGIIKMTGEREDIEIRLNPNDCERIKEFTKDLIDELGLKNGLRLEADKKIEKGGCKAISNLGMIDATIDKQFELLRKELTSRVPKTNSSLVEERIKEPQMNSTTNKIKDTKILDEIKKPTEDIASEDVAKTIRERLKKDE